MQYEKMFSIIVPVYNTEKYLEQCLESVVTQDYKDFELIIVNNGSKDDSYKIINRYKDNKNVKVIDVEVNRGISNARNIALRQSQGEYIIFLDSDDYYNNNNFLNDANKLLKNKKYDLVLFKSRQYFDANDKYGKLIQNIDSQYINNHGLTDDVRYLVTNNCFDASSWNKIVRKQVILDNDLFFVDGIRGEDIEWHYRLMKSVSSLGALDDIMHAYRIRNSSTSKSGWNEKCWNDIYVFLKDEYPNIWSLDKEHLLLLDLYILNFYILLGMAQKYDNKEELINKLKCIIGYNQIHFCKKNKICSILVKLFGLQISSKIIYKYILR